VPDSASSVTPDPDDLPETEPAGPPSLDVTPVAEALGLTPASEVARAALNRARAAAQARGLRPGSPASADPGRGRGHSRAAGPDLRSGAGRDGRDPVPLGDTLARLAAERGWSTELSVGGVIGRWREVVGDQVADHCTPETFADGVLAVRADSTAWAAELTLLTPRLLERLALEVGVGVVQEVRVIGPAAPRWSKGRRQVPGRGPRDTYG
jgi:predicted nucleic acid-binding Zn ribbon protein